MHWNVCSKCAAWKIPSHSSFVIFQAILCCCSSHTSVSCIPAGWYTNTCSYLTARVCATVVRMLCIVCKRTNFDQLDSNCSLISPVAIAAYLHLRMSRAKIDASSHPTCSPAILYCFVAPAGTFKRWSCQGRRWAKTHLIAPIMTHPYYYYYFSHYFPLMMFHDYSLFSIPFFSPLMPTSSFWWVVHGH